MSTEEKVQEWANENAILMDSMDDYGSPIEYNRELQLKKERKNYSGQFTRQEEIISFVMGEHCYATPLAEEAQKFLTQVGFEETNNVPVPFVAIGSFPGVPSTDVEKSLWFTLDGEMVNNPAERVLRYYYEVLISHSGYQKWVELLKRKGKYKQELDPILYNIKMIKNQIEAYNEYANEQIEKILEEDEEKILIR
jgi:hypothetical protein